VKNLEQKSYQKTFRALVFVVAVFSILFSSLKNSFAEDATGYGVGRTRSCSATGRPETLLFDPTSGGKDVEFNLSNPVCTYVAISIYAAVKIAIANMNRVCGSGSSIPRITPSPIQDSIDLTRASVTAASGNTQCSGAIGYGAAGFSLAMSQIAIIYGIAKSVYDDSHVCGSNWMGPNVKEYDMSTPSYKQTVQLAIEGYIRDSSPKLSINSGDKTYREWIYGGVEVEDNPSEGEEACRDPTEPKAQVQYPLQLKVTEEYQLQKYYLKGLEAGNFNCKKYFLPAGSDDPLTKKPATSKRLSDFQKAYSCCQSRSQNYICIHYDDSIADGTPDHVFCRAGSICRIKNISFSTKTLTHDQLICAESYSLCPYNFALSGGTEYCDYYKDGIWNSSEGRWKMITQDQISAASIAGNCSTYSEIRDDKCILNEKAGKCRNYCQYLTHCTKTSTPSFPYQSGLGSPYFSDACINFVGDSQNKTAFNGGFLLGSQRHFSAPIAQCVKETLENLFYNRAGHSSCQNTNEYPSSDGSCPSEQYIRDGNFTYKKGNMVKDTSFFGMIQNNMQNLVRLTITMSIMFYGMNILVGKNNIGNRKDILTYIFKIAVVLYFATGDAWQSTFFKGVYGAGAEFSRMVFKIGLDSNTLKQDGCQFGTYTFADGTLYNSGRNYPAGKEYLALWDTLDCKIMRYLGYGPEVSDAHIASLIFAALFTGAPGFYFAMSVLFMAFFFIAATIRALHIFLSACLSIIIFVFVSPLIIPLCLFKKTENIFKGWLTNLISFCFQPIILFAYIAIFCTIMDKTMIGSATFVGDPPSKTISCKEICKNSDGTIVPFVNGEEPACDQTGQKIYDPNNDSVACLINLNDFGTAPGFEIVGISIPILDNLLTGDIKAKLLTILRGFIVMFLLYKFMDEIPGIASSLIGGTKLPSSEVNAIAMLAQTAGMIRSAQLRAFRGGKKATKLAYNKAKGIARDLGNSGKSVSGLGKSVSGASEKSEGSDHDGGRDNGIARDGGNSGKSVSGPGKSEGSDHDGG
jgi:type IV secretory pathway VirB6-like protein